MNPNPDSLGLGREAAIASTTAAQRREHPPTPSGGFYVRAGTVVDGISSAPLRDAVIRVDRGRITWVRVAEAVGVLDPALRVFDYPNGAALPGLIDTHAHFSLTADGRSYEDMARDSDELQAYVAGRNVGAHLAAGVTTARDNGSRNRVALVLREAIELGYVPGPRLLVCGRPVTPSGGHFAWCNGTADGVGGIRGAIERLVGDGVDHVKVMASGGATAGTNPTRACYSVDELRAAAESAHAFGKLTTAHCRATEAMDRAIASGLDCMEHGEFLDLDGRLTFDPDIAKRLADSGMFLGPTLSSNGWDTVVRLRKQAASHELKPDEEHLLVSTEREIETRLEHFQRLLDLGMTDRLIAGTDAGCFDASFGHLDFALKLMVRGGMSPIEAIKSATSVAATACGVEDDVGSLRPGRRADIAILRADPSESIEAIGDVVAVFKDGLVVASRP